MQEFIHNEIDTIQARVCALDAAQDGKTGFSGQLGSIYIPHSLRRDLEILFGQNDSLLSKRCLEIARKGSLDAVSLIALLYYNGAIHTASRLENAAAWASIASDCRDPFGTYVLGMTELEAGRHSEALTLFEASAMAGFGPSAWVAGKIFEEGIGVYPDATRAAFFYERAAKSGYFVGKISFLNVAKTGKLGFLAGLLAFVTTPIHKTIFLIRNRLAYRIHDRYLFPKRMVNYLSKYVNN